MEENTEEETLKTLLAKADLTQQELAKRIRVSVSLIGFYVAGKKTPGFDKAIAMSKVLKVPLKTLAKAMGYDITGIPDDVPLSRN